MFAHDLPRCHARRQAHPLVVSESQIRFHSLHSHSLSLDIHGTPCVQALTSLQSSHDCNFQELAEIHTLKRAH
uniref:Uncharacterized protein n=1 Tax=Arundo donax TaxID=35708 RepID=A0A0A9H7K6_ARUDO